jgi:transposase
VAKDKKKWRTLKATLVLIDESGFSLVSPLKRSWSPRGQTPAVRTSLNHHQRLNVLGALLVSPCIKRIRLTIRSYQTSLGSVHAIAFLRHLLRLIPGQIVLVWDNHKIHVCPQTQKFIEQHRDRLHVYRFPTYAPELNPVEFVWTQVGEHHAGFAAHNMPELCQRIRAGVSRTRKSKHRLRICLKSSGLSWK